MGWLPARQGLEAFSPCSTALDGRGAGDARKSRTHALSDEERPRPQCARRLLTPCKPWLLVSQVLSRLAGGTCYEADFLAFATNAQALSATWWNNLSGGSYPLALERKRHAYDPETTATR